MCITEAQKTANLSTDTINAFRVVDMAMHDPILVGDARHVEDFQSSGRHAQECECAMPCVYVYVHVCVNLLPAQRFLP